MTSLGVFISRRCKLKTKETKKIEDCGKLTQRKMMTTEDDRFRPTETVDRIMTLKPNF